MEKSGLRNGLPETRAFRYGRHVLDDDDDDWLLRQTLVDIDLFSDIKRIEDALAQHSCVEALAWCSEHKAALRKIKVNPHLRCGPVMPHLDRVTEHTGIWAAVTGIYRIGTPEKKRGSYCVYEETPSPVAGNSFWRDQTCFCTSCLSTNHNVWSLQSSSG